MDRDTALDVLGNAMADPGRLTPERQTEVGQAVVALLGTLLTDVGRIADALDRLALCAVPLDGFGHNELRVGANCDTRRVG